MTNPKISIITVTYNCESLIERTLESIRTQNYSNKEVIVIDGCSKDKTFDIINQFLDCIDVKVHEPDNGIFDAMNKGIAMSSGEWLYFLNAGDVFEDSNVLSKIFREKICGEVPLVYGDIKFYSDGKDKEVIFQSKPFFKNNKRIKHMGISHQGMFIRRKYAQEYLYDYTNFPLCADYRMVTEIYESNKNFLYKPIVVAKFLRGGTSNKNSISQYKELAKICGVPNSLWNMYYAKGLIMICKTKILGFIRRKL